jgi:hypothetical protein
MIYKVFTPFIRGRISASAENGESSDRVSHYAIFTTFKFEQWVRVCTCAEVRTSRLACEFIVGKLVDGINT